MSPIYTITSNDVSVVAPESKLTAGVVFDWGAQEIRVPPSVSAVNARWLVDNCRFAEQSDVGIARSQIVDAFGNYQKGIDPETLLPEYAGVDAILLDNWLVVTEKTTGDFVITDVLKADGSFPYEPVAGVNIRYVTATRASVVQVDTGGTFTADDRAKLAAIETRVDTIPVNPVLANDVRLDYLDASIAGLPAPDNAAIAAIQQIVNRLHEITGFADGVSVTAKPPTVGTPGYRSLSTGASQTWTVDIDGIETLSKD